MYLKEHDHIRSSEKMIDDQISIAIATKENLQSQRKVLGTITQKMNSLASILLKNFYISIKLYKLKKTNQHDLEVARVYLYTTVLWCLRTKVYVC
ncbi:Hypothetical predicted protein [Mytilus galloprovincialis]|uniref:Golgi SNAP receptor complex member 1 n=1 Tax=Mytilus galloprovincialis TaxID=29158 RepID=A0A8B6D3G5_MYTGA|nr:Hypothetical predicted protein [Mytilus galloprovincialis]